MRKHLFAHMTWEEVNDAVLERRVVLVPVGQIEEHGLHLPIDTDVVQVSYVCEEAARQAPDVLVSAPAINYGFSEHVMDFPGTMTVRPQVLIDYLVDVGSSFARQGFERIVLVNGHGSNRPMCEVAARLITNGTAALCATLTHFSLAKHVLEEIRESPIGGAAHACEVETSEYLYIRPDLVRQDRIQDEFAPDYRPWRCDDFAAEGPVHFMEYWSQRSKSGAEGAPSLATAEKGRRLLEATIGNLIEFARWFRALELPPRTDHRAKKG